MAAGLDLSRFVRRRRFAADHPFFEEGNVWREWRRADAGYGGGGVLAPRGAAAAAAAAAEEAEAAGGGGFRCGVSGCNKHFVSVAAYASHYAVAHRHRCRTCGAVLPNVRLLDMHVAERHDKFFAATAKRRPSYACVVDGCGGVFATPAERTEHLVQHHLFPRGFSYDLQRRGGRRRWQSTGRCRVTTNAPAGAAPVTTTTTTSTASSCSSSSSRMMELDEEEGEHEQEEEAEGDPAVSDLTTAMRGLRAPTSISFGRHGGRNRRAAGRHWDSPGRQMRRAKARKNKLASATAPAAAAAAATAAAAAAAAADGAQPLVRPNRRERRRLAREAAAAKAAAPQTGTFGGVPT